MQEQPVAEQAAKDPSAADGHLISGTAISVRWSGPQQ